MTCWGDFWIHGSHQIQKSEKAAVNSRPCSTLFIANLGPTCTEAELEQVLSKFSGFRTLKMKGRSGMPVAFADFEFKSLKLDTLHPPITEFWTLSLFLTPGQTFKGILFQDVESSAAALESLRGTTIGSSDRGEIHIEYYIFPFLLWIDALYSLP
ncbi:hypothetical protein KSP40_PGU020078 [Platanthera guangdongensis]|uniref:RRM domain-containing protein n=1 Tax=Platanthera guangdongensis TaxID=2320717 RepID=A0ABR2M0F5_9ASPA